jgi:hypothetical protein
MITYQSTTEDKYEGPLAYATTEEFDFDPTLPVLHEGLIDVNTIPDTETQLGWE